MLGHISLTSPPVTTPCCWHSQVFALCGVCVVYFLVRAAVNAISFFKLLPVSALGFPFMDPVESDNATHALTFDVVSDQTWLVALPACFGVDSVAFCR